MACDQSGSSFLKLPGAGGGANGEQLRRKSTLSGNGFFIDRSCTRRRSSAAAARAHCNQTLRYLSPVHPLTATASDPPRRSSHAYGQLTAASQPASPSRYHHQQQQQRGRSTRACSFAPAASSQSAAAGAMQLLLPVHAPSALAGSRKTSIFDPTGHSIAPHLLIGARRKSAMVGGGCSNEPAAITASIEPVPAERTMLSVAKSAASSRAATGCSTKSERRVQHVPVIGCSPTSIKASLAALDETRRYEKLIRRLRQHEQRKEKRRLRLFDNQSEEQDYDDAKDFRQKRDHCELFTGECSAAESELPAGGGLRRKSLRAIGNVANSVLSRASGSFKRRRRRRRHRLMADGLSVSSMSLASSLSSSSSPSSSPNSALSWSSANASPARSLQNDRCAEDDIDGQLAQLNGGQSADAINSATSSRIHRRQQRQNNDSDENDEDDGHNNGSKTSGGKRSLVRAAMRKLASTIVQQTTGNKRRPKAQKWRSMSTAGGVNMNYWYYYYYLRENSIDTTMSAIDDLPLSGVGGSSGATGAGNLSATDSRLHINYSLARIEILNSKILDPSVQLAQKLAQAGELAYGYGASGTTTGGGEQWTSLFDYSNQSTDVSLALSTSTSSADSDSGRSDTLLSSSSSSLATSEASPSSPLTPRSAASSIAAGERDSSSAESTFQHCRRQTRTRNSPLPQHPRSVSAEPTTPARRSASASLSSGDGHCAATSAALSADDECTLASGAIGDSVRRHQHDHLSLCHSASIRDNSNNNNNHARAAALSVQTCADHWTLGQRKSAPWESSTRQTSADSQQQQQQRQSSQQHHRHAPRGSKVAAQSATAAFNSAAGVGNNTKVGGGDRRNSRKNLSVREPHPKGRDYGHNHKRHNSSHLAKASSSSSISGKRSSSFVANNYNEQQNDDGNVSEELDDFERLNRCHKNYKPPVTPVQSASLVEGRKSSKVAVSVKPRSSSNRLSVRSAHVSVSRSPSPSRLIAAEARGASSRISLSWDTLTPSPEQQQQQYQHQHNQYQKQRTTCERATQRRSFKVPSSQPRVSSAHFAVNRHGLCGSDKDDWDSSRGGNGSGSLSIDYDNNNQQYVYRGNHQTVSHLSNPEQVPLSTTGVHLSQLRGHNRDTTASTSLPLNAVRGFPQFSTMASTACFCGDQSVCLSGATSLEIPRLSQRGGDVRDSFATSPTTMTARTDNNNDNDNHHFQTQSKRNNHQQQQQQQQQFEQCSICTSQAMRLDDREFDGREFVGISTQQQQFPGCDIGNQYQWRQRHSMRYGRTALAQNNSGNDATQLISGLSGGQTTGVADRGVELRARAHSTGAGSGCSEQQQQQRQQYIAVDPGKVGGSSRHLESARRCAREEKSRVSQRASIQQPDGATHHHEHEQPPASSPSPTATTTILQRPNQAAAAGSDLPAATAPAIINQLEKRHAPRDSSGLAERKKCDKLDKGSFTCMLVGARQTGKRTIVKCFVKLLQEFQLAAAEYKREKLLAKLMGCSEHLQEIMSNRESATIQFDQKQQQQNQRRSSRLNSWFGGSGSTVNRLLSLPTGITKRRVNSVAVTSGLGLGNAGAGTNHLVAIDTNGISEEQSDHLRDHHQRRHTTTVGDRSSRDHHHQFLRVDAPAPVLDCGADDVHAATSVNFKLSSCNKSDTNINYHNNNNNNNDSNSNSNSNSNENASSSFDESIGMNQLQVPTLGQHRRPQTQTAPIVGCNQSSPAAIMNETSLSSPSRRSVQLQPCPVAVTACKEQQTRNMSVQISKDRRGQVAAASTVRRGKPVMISLKELNRKRVRILFKTRRQLSERYTIDKSGEQNNLTNGKQATSSAQDSLLLPDCFVVIYAVNDRESFNYAVLLVKQLRSIKQDTPLPILVVANKIDLERAKVVKSEEGRLLARKNSCKFLEISCTIGFNLDNLLVGIRTQLILKHHVVLNAILRSSGKPSAVSINNSNGPQADKRDVTTSKRASDNILVRFYKRYVMDNSESNYDCDNFAKL